VKEGTLGYPRVGGQRATSSHRQGPLSPLRSGPAASPILQSVRTIHEASSCNQRAGRMVSPWTLLPPQRPHQAGPSPSPQKAQHLQVPRLCCNVQGRHFPAEAAASVNDARYEYLVRRFKEGMTHHYISDGPPADALLLNGLHNTHDTA
jgi:hypothetical protein